MWFRGLIAVACVAVIAFVGTFFWERYEASRRADERATFESFCDLQFGAAGSARRQRIEVPVHVQEGMARCKAAGYAPSTQ